MRGGNPMQMMQQFQKMQEQLMQTREELAGEVVTASVGGGVVNIVMTGSQFCQSVEISPDLLEEDDVEMLQDLLVSAINQAIELSQTLAAERLGPLGAGLGL